MVVLVSINPNFKYEDSEEFTITPDQLYKIINDPGAICHDLLGFRSINFGQAYFKIISYENNSNKRFAWRFTSNRRKS